MGALPVSYAAERGRGASFSWASALECGEADRAARAGVGQVAPAALRRWKMEMPRAASRGVVWKGGGLEHVPQAVSLALPPEAAAHRIEHLLPCLLLGDGVRASV